MCLVLGLLIVLALCLCVTSLVLSCETVMPLHFETIFLLVSGSNALQLNLASRHMVLVSIFESCPKLEEGRGGGGG